MDRNYQIVFTADTSNALAGMKMLETEFKMLESYVNGTGSGLGNMTGQLNNLTAQCHGAAAALGGAGTATKTLGDHIVGLATSWLVIEAGTAALGKFGEMANTARDKIKEMAIDTMELRDKMRELANLKGADGPDNIVAGEAIKLGMDTGMLPAEATKYLEQFEGSSPAGVQKGNIDPATKQAMMVEGAKFGTRVKLAPGTAGDLAGVISQYTDLVHNDFGKELLPQQRIDKGVAQMGRIAYGLNEGRGNLEPLVRSLLNTAGAVVSDGGPMEDLAELAAMQGVASTHANPRESGTRIRQAVGALRDTTGPAAAYMEQVKIKDGMSHLARLRQLEPDIKKATASGEGADTFLLRQGFTDKYAVRAIVEQVNDLSVIDARLKKSKTITGQTIRQQDKNFLENTRAGQRRKQLATKAGQEFLIGEENERIEMGRETAEQNMRNEHQIGGVGNNAREWAQDWFGAAPFLGYQSTREKNKTMRAMEDLEKEAARLGIPQADIDKVSGRPTVNPNNPGASGQALSQWASMDRWTSERTRVKRYNELADMVERRGGSTSGQGPDLNRKFKDLTEKEMRNRQFAARRPREAAFNQKIEELKKLPDGDARIRAFIEQQFKEDEDRENGRAGKEGDPAKQKIQEQAARVRAGMKTLDMDGSTRAKSNGIDISQFLAPAINDLQRTIAENNRLLAAGKGATTNTRGPQPAAPAPQPKAPAAPRRP